MVKLYPWCLNRPIGYLAITDIPVAINQGYIGIVCDKGISNYTIYLWCQDNMELIENSGNGSVFQEIAKSTFKSLVFMKPDVEICIEVDGLVEPLFRKIRINQQQIQTLQKLRDTLLPKLISGEVRAVKLRQLTVILIFLNLCILYNPWILSSP